MTVEKSGEKSGRFAAGRDPRRGRGPRKGTGGRTPDEVRKACRVAFDKRVKVLEAIADNADEPAAIRIKAIEALGKYGLGAMVSGGDSEGNVTDLPPLTVVAVR